MVVRNFKQDIRRDLGDDLTRAQETILEQCARTFLILSALDDWIARQPSVVRKKRSLLPAVRERTQLVDSLTRGLLTLGLHRVAKDADTLESYLARKLSEQGDE